MSSQFKTRESTYNKSKIKGQCVHSADTETKGYARLSGANTFLAGTSPLVTTDPLDTSVAPSFSFAAFGRFVRVIFPWHQYIYHGFPPLSHTLPPTNTLDTFFFPPSLLNCLLFRQTYHDHAAKRHETRSSSSRNEPHALHSSQGKQTHMSPCSQFK